MPAETILPDGLYLPRAVFDGQDRQRRQGQTVRVIYCMLENSAAPAQDSCRLVSSILGPDAALVSELAVP